MEDSALFRGLAGDLFRDERGEARWGSARELAKSANQIKIPKLLTEKERFIATAATRRVQRDPGGFVARYRERFGNTFNADDAAELLPEYNKSHENRTLYIMMRCTT
jgi:hypothetical protein